MATVRRHARARERRRASPRRIDAPAAQRHAKGAPGDGRKDAGSPGGVRRFVTSRTVRTDVLEWTVRSLADEFRRIEAGWVARSRSSPLVRSLNRLQVKATVEPEHVVVLADRLQADLPYRHVEVDDVRTADALEQTLSTFGSGWKVDREVLMVLDGPSASRRAIDGDVPCREPVPDREDAPAAVVRLDARRRTG